jgi:glycosyltransferase involved in cell wall biosynthesis
MITISVIITTFNAAQTIENTILSVLHQDGIDTEFNVQLIVVDDKSTDKTVEIIKRFPEIVFEINKVNSGGPNAGRNKGLYIANGDFITFLDHDDIWKKDKLKKQLRFKNHSVITCGYDLLKNQKFVETVCNESEKGFIEYKKNQSFLSKLAREPKGQICYFGSIMIASELKIIPFEEQFGKCDYDYILNILKDNQSVEVCEPLFYRYVESNNLSLNENYRLQDYTINNQMFTKFETTYPTEVKKGKFRLNAALGRYYFQQSNGKMARKYLSKARLGLVNIALIATSYFGKNIINRFFNVFS